MDAEAGQTTLGEAEEVDQTELARLIETTYQYIYSVEDMRIARRVGKIEDLF